MYIHIYVHVAVFTATLVGMVSFVLIIFSEMFNNLVSLCIYIYAHDSVPLLLK